jgi:hypothetical protein
MFTVWKKPVIKHGSLLEESWDGPLARLFRRYFQKTLDRAVSDGLRALKVEAERRHGD